MEEATPPEEPTGREKRSILNVLVDPGFQLRYALFAGTVASTCALALYFIFLFHTLDVIASPNLYLSSDRGIAVYDEIRNWGFAVLGIGTLLAAVSFVATLRHSHRIAGPLQRIDMYLDQILRGERGEALHLRETDEFRELSEKLNVVAERLESAERAADLDVTRV